MLKKKMIKRKISSFFCPFFIILSRQCIVYLFQLILYHCEFFFSRKYFNIDGCPFVWVIYCFIFLFSMGFNYTPVHLINVLVSYCPSLSNNTIDDIKPYVNTFVILLLLFYVIFLSSYYHSTID